MSDYDGDEQWDIFLVSPKTGQVVNLTNTREIAEESPTWSPDGRYLAYMVKPKTSSVFEIDVYDTVMRDVKHLTTGTAKDRMNVTPIWSADGKFIVYTQEQSKGTDSNIFLVEVASAQSTLLTPHEGEKTFHANDVSPDGKNVLITSNAGNGYDNVGLLDIANKKIQLAHARQVGDFWRQSFSPDGKFLTYNANVDGNTDIYLYDIATGKAHALPLPKGLNLVVGQDFALHARQCAAALLPHRADRSRRFVGLHARRRQIRINSRTRWWAACAPKTWSNLTSFTIPARMASGRSPPSSMCPTTCRATASIPRLSTFTAVRRRRR